MASRSSPNVHGTHKTNLLFARVGTAERDIGFVIMAARRHSLDDAFVPTDSGSPADKNHWRNRRPLCRVNHRMEEVAMDQNRVEGTARNLGGKVQERFGKVTGNARTQAEGLANQVAGAAQDLYGQAADRA
jgi:uncharacterized protein YjbJ (UPF0337 family)